MAGWRLTCLSIHSSVIFRKVFSVSAERRRAARFVLGNPISFSLAQLVQLSYLLVASYSFSITIFDTTVSEMHFKLVERSAAPKTHQLNVQTIFFKVSS